ncbi:MAG: DMT family transporter, partial [Pseudomonadota bacterium]
SFVDSGAKWLAIAGLPALQLSFMRYFTHLAISVFIAVKSGAIVDHIVSGRPLLVLVRALLLVGSTVSNFFAIRYLPLTLTSTILFSAPIIICALSWPMLGERVGIWRWCAILFGFCGIVIAIRPFDESFHIAVLLSIASAICFALYSILTRKLSGTVAADTMQLYVGLAGVIALFPFAFAEWKNPETAGQWVILFGLGFFGWLGHQLLTRAHGYAPANLMMPFGYSFILYLTAWSYVLFDHLPDAWTITGAIMIVISGLVIWYRERIASRELVQATNRSKHID